MPSLWSPRRSRKPPRWGGRSGPYTFWWTIRRWWKLWRNMPALTGCVFPSSSKWTAGTAVAAWILGGRAALELARRIHSREGLELRGILTHAGHSYQARNAEEIRRIAGQEREVIVEFAQRLRGAGIPCPEISVGSTPTAVHAEHWQGVTEIRPGNYLFFDRYQLEIGSCRLEDCAATVLVRVLGVSPRRRQLVVDGGALAFSKDPGPTHRGGKTVYGLVRDHPQLQLVSLSQEHGVLRARGPLDPEAFPPGRPLRIIPNHACLAAALFPRYYAVEGERVVEEWVPVRGW